MNVADNMAFWIIGLIIAGLLAQFASHHFSAETRRFGLSLQDGNHLGVSPSRDFFLLANVAEDKDPKEIAPADLVKLSRNASGAGHPSPWAMTYPTANEKELPKVIVNEHEHVVLETKLKTKSGELAIGLVLIGKTEG